MQVNYSVFLKNAMSFYEKNIASNLTDCFFDINKFKKILHSSCFRAKKGKTRKLFIEIVMILHVN